MHDHHHHEHASGTRDRGRRALVWALALNGGFLVIEGGVGLMTNSLALLSDAAHMLSDVATLVMALVATKLAQREPLPHQTFGLLRAEVMGAFLNGIALLAACTWILVEALERVAEPPQVPGLPMFVVGAIGLAINLGSAWGLWRSGHHNLNIRWHVACGPGYQRNHRCFGALRSLGRAPRQRTRPAATSATNDQRPGHAHSLE